MPPTPTLVQPLPLDADGILALAARSMFQLFSTMSQGMFLADRAGRIVWVNEGYQRFLPDLGVASVDEFLGHMVEDVIPNTRMRRVLETGEPVLIDLLTNRAGTFVVSRIPLKDDAGAVIGAIGIVLFDQPETTLQPLISKFAVLQRDLDEARRELAAQRNRSLRVAVQGERRAKYSFASFVGSSPAAVEVKRQARRAAQSLSPVLLLGETGTGKELLAHAIHAASARSGGPFVTVNIAAVPDALLEAEFFGVTPGAFTGADRKPRDGKFRLADGGTLFLDEIGDMPFDLQTRLLRVLSDGQFYRVGGHNPLRANVRVIAATHQNLESRVRQGLFREDLYHRLNVIRLRLPPLRERSEDIALLTRHFLQKSARDLGVEPKRVSDEALAYLTSLAFPGNVRQLENLANWLTVMAPAQTVEIKDLPPDLVPAGAPVAAAGDGADAHGNGGEAALAQPATGALPAVSAPVAAAPNGGAPAGYPVWEHGLRTEVARLLRENSADVMDELARRFEAAVIREALDFTRGRKVEAAERLGIGRNTITRKIQELHLEP